MTKKALTKDERFLCELYKKTKEEGKEILFDAREIGKKVGLSEKSTSPVIILLAQANFIKKLDKFNVKITEHGSQLVHMLEPSHEKR